MVERLLELGVDPKLVTLEMGDTPLHAALSIALDKDEGWSCCLVYVERGHTPFTLLWSSPWTRRVVRCAVCGLCGERPHTLHLTLVITLDKKSGQVCCVWFMWREATHPSPYSGHHLGQEEWSGMLCVVYVERGHTPFTLLWSSPWTRRVVRCAVCGLCGERPHVLHPSLVIALDKENGQVCCVCCVRCLCGEKWHMDIALDMHLVICRKRPQPVLVLSVLVKPFLTGRIFVCRTYFGQFDEL